MSDEGVRVVKKAVVKSKPTTNKSKPVVKPQPRAQPRATEQKVQKKKKVVTKPSVKKQKKVVPPVNLQRSANQWCPIVVDDQV